MFGNLTPWERVNMARHPKRPLAGDYLAALDQFDELHGDRHFRDDPALVGGFAKLRGRRVVVIAQQKGRDTKENIRRNFGMVSPEGYRKASADGLASRFRSADRHVRRHVGRRSRHRLGRARAIRSDRACLVALAEGRFRSWRRSSAKAAAAARSRSRSPIT
jgi:hypothetical protein